MKNINDLTYQIIGCAYKVHSTLGPGLLESIDQFAPIHKAQLLTYMKLSGKKLGLLISFNVPNLQEGIVRMIL